MRKTKFRIWDKKNKAWEKEHSCYGIGLDGTIHRHFDNDDIIIQQYTGLKDKNGVEIYEGDRIIFDNSDIGGQRYEGIVEWNSDQSLDNLCWGLWIPNKGWLHCDFLGELEVIGNIFEGVDSLQ